MTGGGSAPSAPRSLCVLTLVGLRRCLRRHEHAEPAQDRRHQSLRREAGAAARQARLGDPAGERQQQPRRRRQADRCCRRSSRTTRWSQPGGVASNAPGHLALARRGQERMERGRRHRLELLRQAHGQPDRLRRQGLHAGCGRQGLGIQRLGRLGGLAGLDDAARTRRTRKGSAAAWPRTAAASMPAPAIGYRGGARRQDRQQAVGEERRARRCAPRRRPRASACSSSPRRARSSACRARTARSSGASAACPSAPACSPTPAPPSTATSSWCPIRAVISWRCASPTASRSWSESLSRTRTASSMAAMSDTARPAIDGGTVFAVGHAGRMVATVAEDRRAPVVADGAEQSRRPGWPASPCSWSTPPGS